MDSIGGMLLGKMAKTHHKTEVCNVLLEKANGFNGILMETIIMYVIVSIGLLLFFVSMDISEGLPFLCQECDACHSWRMTTVKARHNWNIAIHRCNALLSGARHTFGASAWWVHVNGGYPTLCRFIQPCVWVSDAFVERHCLITDVRSWPDAFSFCSVFVLRYSRNSTLTKLCFSGGIACIRLAQNWRVRASLLLLS